MVQWYGHLGSVTFLQWDVISLNCPLSSALNPWESASWSSFIFLHGLFWNLISLYLELLFHNFFSNFSFSFLFLFLLTLFFVWRVSISLKHHGFARLYLYFLTSSFSSHRTPNLGFCSMLSIYLYHISKRVIGSG